MHETTTRTSTHYSVVHESNEAAQRTATSIPLVTKTMAANTITPKAPHDAANSVAPKDNARLGSRPCADSIANRTSQNSIAVLSPTELAVAKLIADGLSNIQAGRALFISHRTVEVHLTHIYAKLGLSSRLQLALFVCREAVANQPTGQGVGQGMNQVTGHAMNQPTSETVGYGNDPRNADGNAVRHDDHRDVRCEFGYELTATGKGV